jgi:hypothetical protein
MKKYIPVIIIMFCCIHCSKNGTKEIINEPKYNNKFEIINTFTYDFYETDEDHLICNPSNIYIDEMENVFILDPKLGCIKVFDKDMNYLYKFGKTGDGPGEFSKETRIMRNFNESMLMIFDTKISRLSYFTLKGDYIGDKKLKSIDIDDILYHNGRYYTSKLILNEKFHPLNILDTGFIVKKEFGAVFPINSRIYNELKLVKYPGTVEKFFTSGTGCHIVVCNNYLFYAQSAPYYIMKSNLDGEPLLNFKTKTDFSDEFDLLIQTEGESVTTRINKPSGTFSCITNYHDSLLLVVFTKPPENYDKDSSALICYADFYNCDGINISRVKINLGIRNPANVIKVIYDNVHDNLYMLMYSDKRFPMLKKFKIKCNRD